MRIMTEECIKTWQAENANKDSDPNREPTSILVYRDGVSESQFKFCIDEELHHIRNAFKNVFGYD
jgi:eukaryotic translation initiation factor 2C